MGRWGKLKGMVVPEKAGDDVRMDVEQRAAETANEFSVSVLDRIESVMSGKGIDAVSLARITGHTDAWLPAVTRSVRACHGSFQLRTVAMIAVALGVSLESLLGIPNGGENA